MLQDQIATMLSKFWLSGKEKRGISGYMQAQVLNNLLVNRLGHFGASRQLTKRSGDCKEQEPICEELDSKGLLVNERPEY